MGEGIHRVSRHSRRHNGVSCSNAQCTGRNCAGATPAPGPRAHQRSYQRSTHVSGRREGPHSGCRCDSNVVPAYALWEASAPTQRRSVTRTAGEGTPAGNPTVTRGVLLLAWCGPRLNQAEKVNARCDADPSPHNAWEGERTAGDGKFNCSGVAHRRPWRLQSQDARCEGLCVFRARSEATFSDNSHPEAQRMLCYTYKSRALNWWVIDLIKS